MSYSENLFGFGSVKDLKIAYARDGLLVITLGRICVADYSDQRKEEMVIEELAKSLRSLIKKRGLTAKGVVITGGCHCGALSPKGRELLVNYLEKSTGAKCICLNLGGRG